MTKPAPVSDKPISDEQLREIAKMDRSWRHNIAAELLAAREALRPFAWDLRDDDLKGERGNEEHDHLIRVAWIREARRCLPEPARPTASGG